LQFTCQDLSAFSECQEIDFLSGKQAEFQVSGGSKLPVGQMKLFSAL